MTTQYVFDFDRYRDAFVELRRCLADRDAAQRRLEEAETKLGEIEGELGQRWDEALAAVRVRAMEADAE